MVRLRGMWIGLVPGTALVLGTVVLSRQAGAQSGSSPSLSHVVTTVLPRVRVTITPAPAFQGAVRASSAQTATDGISISITATQSWTLSIGSGARESHLQWSHDQTSGFANVGVNDSTIASGASSGPATFNIFFRGRVAVASSDQRNGVGPDVVVLTVAAQ